MDPSGANLSAADARSRSYAILSLTQAFQALNPVTLEAAGAITQVSGIGSAAALIGGSVILHAHTGIGPLQLAIDTLADAHTSTGSINLARPAVLRSSV